MSRITDAARLPVVGRPVRPRPASAAPLPGRAEGRKSGPIRPRLAADLPFSITPKRYLSHRRPVAALARSFRLRSAEEPFISKAPAVCDGAFRESKPAIRRINRALSTVVRFVAVHRVESRTRLLQKHAKTPQTRRLSRFRRRLGRSRNVTDCAQRNPLQGQSARFAHGNPDLFVLVPADDQRRIGRQTALVPGREIEKAVDPGKIVQTLDVVTHPLRARIRTQLAQRRIEGWGGT